MYRLVFIILIIILVCCIMQKKTMSSVESFAENGLTHYLDNTTGFVCDKDLDNTNHNKNVCNRLAHQKEVVDILKKMFVDKPTNLLNISRVWDRNYSHGKARGLLQENSIDYYGNDLEYHRLWKEDCEKFALANKNAAGYTVVKNQPSCWIKSKMTNRRSNGNRISYRKGNGHQFTISFWIKIDSLKRGWRQILRCGYPWGTSRCPGLWIYPNGTGLHCRVSTDKNWNEGLDLKNGDISLKRWTHLTITLKEKLLKIYKDGLLIKESKLWGNPNFPDKMTIYGGSKYSSHIHLAKVRFNKLCMNDYYIKNMLFTELHSS